MPFGQHKADFEEGDPECQLSQGCLLRCQKGAGGAGI